MKNLKLKVYDNNKDLKKDKPLELEFKEIEAYARLTESLISKKINSCSWVKSIKYTNLYSCKQIKIVYDNDVIDIFTYED